MEILHETRDHCEAIYALTKAAFAPMPFSDDTEAERVNKLRSDQDLHLSLVAVDEDRIVGHIAFSPVTLSGSQDGWLGLGPVSVWPEFQKTGAGSLLIKSGLEIIRQQNKLGCVLIGDPKYYSKFGFVGDGKVSYRDLPKKYVQWLAFTDERACGEITFSAGLE